jgi:hypothetical protein
MDMDNGKELHWNLTGRKSNNLPGLQLTKHLQPCRRTVPATNSKICLKGYKFSTPLFKVCTPLGRRCKVSPKTCYNIHRLLEEISGNLKKKRVNWSHQIRKKKYSLLRKKSTAKRVPNRSKSVFKNLQLVAATLSCVKSLSRIPCWHRKLMLTAGKTKIMCTLDVSFLLEWDKGLPWTLMCLSPASTWLSMTFYCHGKP